MRRIAGAPRFALLGHPADYPHFAQLIENRDGEIVAARIRKHEAAFSRFIDWMPPYATSYRPVLRTPDLEIEGRLLICPILPQQMTTPQHLKRAHEKVEQACRLAAEMGAGVMALGGFTSILAGPRANRLASELGLTITSGNALTAALAVAQLHEALGTTDQISEPVAILGATGDIGRTCAHLLAEAGVRLRLVARDPPRLEALRAALPGAPAKIVSLDEAISGTRVIIAATSSAEPLITLDQLRPDAVVADVGFPKTLSGRSERADVTVFDAGLARLPHDMGLEAYTNLGRSDLLFGCFAEGLVLAALPELAHLASLQGEADGGKARTLFEAARRLGIRPGPLSHASRPSSNVQKQQAPKVETVA